MPILRLQFGLARAAAFLFAVCLAARVSAGGLSDVFRKELGGLELEPLGPALAKTVASTYPVASASSSITYTFDPATESFERQTRVLGPIIGERAETLGKGQVDASLSYSYVNLTSINGQSLDSLTNKPSINGRVVSFPVPDGVILADGRYSNFLPVKVDADIGVDAHLITPGVTYGLTADWDVNLTLPIIRTALDVDAKVTVPDPRFPQFALPAGDPNIQDRKISSSDDSVGVGDLLLRTKYMLHRGGVADVAAFLGISAPTGDQDDFQGTGDWEVQPSLIVSRVIADRVEPLLNVGVDIDADDVDRSVVRWGAGATGQLTDQLSLAMIFFGRHELDSQADEIDAPFFFRIERNDQIDLSVGLRYFLLERAVIAANFLVPLNEEGLRADFIPTVQIEYSF